MINSAEISYEALPGSGRRSGFQGINGTATLWLGPDHLLSVETNGYTESYRRFYFKDIQAIQLCRTQGHVWRNLIGLAMLVLGGLFFVLIGEGIGYTLAMFWGIVWGIYLIVNLNRGATCKATIRTAVQTDQLPAFSRMSQAHRILQRIVPLIEAAQGGIVAPEDGRARLAELQRRMLHVSFGNQGQQMQQGQWSAQGQAMRAQQYPQQQFPQQNFQQPFPQQALSQPADQPNPSPNPKSESSS